MIEEKKKYSYKLQRCRLHARDISPEIIHARNSARDIPNKFSHSRTRARDISIEIIHARNSARDIPNEFSHSRTRARDIPAELPRTHIKKTNDLYILIINIKQTNSMEHLIIRINLRGLKNETHVEVHENIDRIFVKYNPQTLGISALYPLYKAAYGNEVAALDIVMGSEVTQKITRQDRLRDTIYRGLVDTVSAAMHHFNPAHVEAAHAINNVIKSYRNISKKTLDDESAAIDDLIRELEDLALTPAVTLIGLTVWKDKLKEENTTFKQLMTERYDEAAAKTSFRMRTTRSETDKFYHAIVNRLESDHLAGVAIDEDFVKDLNVVLERFKHLLAQAGVIHRPNNKE